MNTNPTFICCNEKNFSNDTNINSVTEIHTSPFNETAGGDHDVQCTTKYHYTFKEHSSANDIVCSHKQSEIGFSGFGTECEHTSTNRTDDRTSQDNSSLENMQNFCGEITDLDVVVEMRPESAHISNCHMEDKLYPENVNACMWQNNTMYDSNEQALDLSRLSTRNRYESSSFETDVKNSLTFKNEDTVKLASYLDCKNSSHVQCKDVHLHTCPNQSLSGQHHPISTPYYTTSDSEIETTDQAKYMPEICEQSTTIDSSLSAVHRPIPMYVNSRHSQTPIHVQSDTPPYRPNSVPCNTNSSINHNICCQSPIGSQVSRNGADMTWSASQCKESKKYFSHSSNKQDIKVPAHSQLSSEVKMPQLNWHPNSNPMQSTQIGRNQFNKMFYDCSQPFCNGRYVSHNNDEILSHECDKFNNISYHSRRSSMQFCPCGCPYASNAINISKKQKSAQTWLNFESASSEIKYIPEYISENQEHFSNTSLQTSKTENPGHDVSMNDRPSHALNTYYNNNLPPRIRSQAHDTGVSLNCKNRNEDVVNLSSGMLLERTNTENNTITPFSINNCKDTTYMENKETCGYGKSDLYEEESLPRTCKIIRAKQMKSSNALKRKMEKRNTDSTSKVSNRDADVSLINTPTVYNPSSSDISQTALKTHSISSSHKKQILEQSDSLDISKQYSVFENSSIRSEKYCPVLDEENMVQYVQKFCSGQHASFKEEVDNKCFDTASAPSLKREPDDIILQPPNFNINYSLDDNRDETVEVCSRDYEYTNIGKHSDSTCYSDVQFCLNPHSQAESPLHHTCQWKGYQHCIPWNESSNAFWDNSGSTITKPDVRLYSNTVMQKPHSDATEQMPLNLSYASKSHPSKIDQMDIVNVPTINNDNHSRAVKVVYPNGTSKKIKSNLETSDNSKVLMKDNQSSPDKILNVTTFSKDNHSSSDNIVMLPSFSTFNHSSADNNVNLPALSKGNHSSPHNIINLPSFSNFNRPSSDNNNISLPSFSNFNRPNSDNNVSLSALTKENNSSPDNTVSPSALSKDHQASPDNLPVITKENSSNSNNSVNLPVLSKKNHSSPDNIVSLPVLNKGNQANLDNVRNLQTFSKDNQANIVNIGNLPALSKENQANPPSIGKHSAPSKDNNPIQENVVNSALRNENHAYQQIETGSCQKMSSSKIRTSHTNKKTVSKSLSTQKITNKVKLIPSTVTTHLQSNPNCCTIVTSRGDGIIKEIPDTISCFKCKECSSKYRSFSALLQHQSKGCESLSPSSTPVHATDCVGNYMRYDTTWVGEKCQCTPCPMCKGIFGSKFRVYSHLKRGCYRERIMKYRPDLFQTSDLNSGQSSNPDICRFPCCRFRSEAEKLDGSSKQNRDPSQDLKSSLLHNPYINTPMYPAPQLKVTKQHQTQIMHSSVEVTYSKDVPDSKTHAPIIKQNDACEPNDILIVKDTANAMHTPCSDVTETYQDNYDKNVAINGTTATNNSNIDQVHVLPTPDSTLEPSVQFTKENQYNVSYAPDISLNHLSDKISSRKRKFTEARHTSSTSSITNKSETNTASPETDTKTDEIQLHIESTNGNILQGVPSTTTKENSNCS